MRGKRVEEDWNGVEALGSFERLSMCAVRSNPANLACDTAKKGYDLVACALLPVPVIKVRGGDHEEFL